MATPLLVQFEKEIDRDIAKDTGLDLSSSGEEEESLLEYGPTPQIITNDLRSLDEMVMKPKMLIYDLLQFIFPCSLVLNLKEFQ